MALSGNLRDFDISYIFQIVSQEGKTGRLRLYSQGREGYVIFQNGSIVQAGDETQNVRDMLLRYLADVKGCPAQDVRELGTTFGENVRVLSAELLQRRHISPDELHTFAQLAIEDLACSLFLWKEGNYRFDVLSNVDSYQIGDLSLPADAVTMEAARRTDEWEIIRQTISEGAAFVRTDPGRPNAPQPSALSPLHDYAEYLLTRIDGTSSAKFLAQNSFVSTCRTYEALFRLMQSGRIYPLSDQLSRSVNAALDRSDEEAERQRTSESFLSAVVTVTLMAIIWFAGHILLPLFLLPEGRETERAVRRELVRTHSAAKIAVASLRYEAHQGHPPSNTRDLVQSGLLGDRDVHLPAKHIQPSANPR